MKNSDVERINGLLMSNRWLLDSVNAILLTLPDGMKPTLADGFILIMRGFIRESTRIQEIFSITEPTARPNDPRFISAIETLLLEHMDWMKPLLEEYPAIDSQEDCRLSPSTE